MWQRHIAMVCTAIVLCLSVSTGRADGPAKARRPRLVVLVVFDQMRGDYLTRWHDLFGNDGFRRLDSEGGWFQNCHYPYSDTVTAAGHASLMTGTTPRYHGVIANDWYDRPSHSKVTSVSSTRYVLVPINASGKNGKKTTLGSSPDRLLAPTVGDVLKEATGNKARVIGISLKDRSAILPAGRHADECYWFNARTGNFITSTYYRDHLPDWVTAFNRAHTVDRWVGKKWERLRPELDYARYSSPDDTLGEGVGVGQKRTFPHPFPTKANSLYYAAVFNSPAGNRLLLDFVARAVEGEKLGQREMPDVLCISFSSNDAIGHCWGPDSQEVMDVTLRSDRIVADLLNLLDEHVGRGNYVLALSADHGVCPLPEFAQKHGHEDARRISGKVVNSEAERFLESRFAKGVRWIEATSGWWIYLNQKALKEHGLPSSTVETALADWLKKQPGIARGYTRTELLHDVPADDPIGKRVRASFYPDRCGDVYVLIKPYRLLGSHSTGTSHGTPYPYDTHVPLLVYGTGIHAGVRTDAITPQAIAAIFAHALGIAPPAKAIAAVPAGLFDESGVHGRVGVHRGDCR